jgi:chloramphenicol O-acetyltransferase
VYSPGELAQTAWHRQSAVLAAANSKKSIYSQIKSFFFFVIFLLLEVNHTTVDGFHIRLTKLDHSFRLTRQTNVELLLKHTTTAMSNKKFDSYLKVDFEHFERSSCV